MKPSESLPQSTNKSPANRAENQIDAQHHPQRSTMEHSTNSQPRPTSLSKLGTFFQQALQRVQERSTESLNYLKLRQSIEGQVGQQGNRAELPNNTTTKMLEQPSSQPIRKVTVADRLLEFVLGSAQAVSQRTQQSLQALQNSKSTSSIKVEKQALEKKQPSEQPSGVHKKSLALFASLSVTQVLSKNSSQWQSFKSKISAIRRVDSTQFNSPADDQQASKAMEKSEKPNRSSTKSIKLTQNSLEEEQPFNLTIKTRIDATMMRPSNQSSYLNNDSLNYSNTQTQMADFTANRADSFDRRAESPEKKHEFEEIPEEFIPQELKYTAQELEPNSPLSYHTEEIQRPTKLEVIKREVEELQKKSQLYLEPEERYEDNSPEDSTDKQRVPIEQQSMDLRKSTTPTQQVHPESAVTQRKIGEMQVSPTPYSMPAIKKHKVKLQKEVTRESKDSRQRVESVESRLNTDQSVSQNISRKNLASSRKDDQSVRTPSRSNIFNTEIDSYKERIVMLQEAKSRKRLLQDQLNNLNEQIDVLKKIEEPVGGRKNKIREFIGISDDHEARVRAVQLVNRLKKQREKKQKSMLDGLGRIDNSIIDNMNELARIREQRERKAKQQRKLEIIERMRQHERRKQQNNSLKQASKNFVQAIKQQPHQPSFGNVATEMDNEPELEHRYRKQPTEQYTPDLKQETPELDSKKERLKRLRKFHFNYVSKRSIVEDYNSLLFKN